MLKNRFFKKKRRAISPISNLAPKNFQFSNSIKFGQFSEEIRKMMDEWPSKKLNVLHPLSTGFPLGPFFVWSFAYETTPRTARPDRCATVSSSQPTKMKIVMFYWSENRPIKDDKDTKFLSCCHGVAGMIVLWLHLNKSEPSGGQCWNQPNSFRGQQVHRTVQIPSDLNEFKRGNWNWPLGGILSKMPSGGRFCGGRFGPLRFS